MVGWLSLLVPTSSSLSRSFCILQSLKFNVLFPNNSGGWVVFLMQDFFFLITTGKHTDCFYFGYWLLELLFLQITSPFCCKLLNPEIVVTSLYLVVWHQYASTSGRVINNSLKICWTYIPYYIRIKLSVIWYTKVIIQ